MTIKTLDDFVNGSLTTIAILQQRYSSGFVAFIAPEEYISTMSDAITGGDVEMEDLCMGILATDWYPVGYGETINAALEGLRQRVEGFLEDSQRGFSWTQIYAALSTRFYKYNQGRYLLRNAAKARNLPEWLKTFNSITEAKLWEFAETLDTAR